MSLRILITGTTGESLPPPYAGIPKHSLFLARIWRQLGHTIGITFVYHHQKEDDLGARSEFFFEYRSKPNKIKKIFFLFKFLVRDPLLYFKLFYSYLNISKKISKELFLYSAYGIFIKQVIVAFRPDIILVETALIKSYMVSQVAFLMKIPVAVHTYAEVHDLSMGVNKYLEQRDRENYWKKYFEKISIILSPSNFCALGPLKYVLREKVKTLYFGIDLDKYVSNNEDKDVIRKDFNLDIKDFVIISVGAFTLRKGHDHLIKAISILKKEGVVLKIILCGAGDFKWLKDLAIKEGVGDFVCFFKELSEDNLIRLYKSSDLYCDASNTPRACLGMSLTEAMAVGLPVVAYNVGGIPEVVFDNKNGFLVPVDDIKNLSIKIKEVFNMTEDDRKKMGEEGGQIVKNLFDIKYTAEELLKILIKLKK